MNPAPSTAFYTVDRIEAGIAVLVGDDGVALDVAVRAIPVDVRPGHVLRVPLDPDGTPVWSGATIDPAERERRMRAAREALDRLRRRDPGGDVVL